MRGGCPFGILEGVCPDLVSNRLGVYWVEMRCVGIPQFIWFLVDRLVYIFKRQLLNIHQADLVWYVFGRSVTAVSGARFSLGCRRHADVCVAGHDMEWFVLSAYCVVSGSECCSEGKFPSILSTRLLWLVGVWSFEYKLRFRHDNEEDLLLATNSYAKAEKTEKLQYVFLLKTLEGDIYWLFVYSIQSIDWMIDCQCFFDSNHAIALRGSRTMTY